MSYKYIHIAIIFIFLATSCVQEKKPQVVQQTAKPTAPAKAVTKRPVKKPVSTNDYWQYLRQKINLNTNQINFLKSKRDAYLASIKGKSPAAINQLKATYLKEIEQFLGPALYKKKFAADTQWNLSKAK